MISETIQIEVKTVLFNPELLSKNSWLVVLHANRIPPHVGLLINGNYNSLTIKGHELNISVEALLKIISQKKIECIFIKIKNHPVFSLDYQLQIFQETIKKFEQVRQYEATCLTPIKLFFEEFYAINLINEELFYDFMKRMQENLYLENASSLNFELNKDILELPLYSSEQLNEKIVTERLPYYKD